jgi:hypothetical protein
MNFNKLPGGEKPLEVKKNDYNDLVNDFGVFITLNASKLEQQILPGKEAELAELRENLRKPIIDGLDYAGFISTNWQTLNKPEVGKVILRQIYGFLIYIKPRLVIFKSDSPWVKRFKEVEQKYRTIVSKNS